MIYFDSAATTPLSEKVKNALVNTFDGFFANPSSIHFLGEKSKKLVEESRRNFALFFGVKPNQVIFTSGATESNNFAIKGYLRTTSKKEIIVSPLEHSSVLEVCKELEKQGCTIRYLKIDNIGRVDLSYLEEMINDKTALVAVGAVNNETGVIQDYKAISRVCRERGVPFFSDVVQAFGHIDLDWKCFDFITITAHKIHGPKGIGALILINPNLKIEPLLNGGGQENGYRSGTENVSGIYAFSVALSEINYENSSRIAELKQAIVNSLFESKIDFEINGDLEHSSPYIFNIWLKGYDADTIVKCLSANNICISSASACINNTNGYSHIINTLYNSLERTKSSIRLSFSKYNTIEECKSFLKILNKLLNELEKEN